MSFEEELKAHGGFIFTNVGESMLPLIRQGRDVLEITAKPAGRLKKYDVALYKVGGRYILHRVLKVREKDYVIAGDNNSFLETVTDGQIVGVLSGLTRDGRRVALSGWRYRLYLFFRCDLYHVRIALLRLRGLLGRIKRGIKEVRE